MPRSRPAKTMMPIANSQLPTTRTAITRQARSALTTQVTPKLV